MITIERVDPHDDAALGAWYAVETASIAHDRPDASHRTYTSLTAAVQNATQRRRYILLAAKDRTNTVGTADITLRDAENTHTLEVEIHVLPEYRRQGIGRRLWTASADIGVTEGRATFLGELTVPPQAALAFTAAMGFESVHEEDHLILELPHEVASVPTTGYDIVTWVGPCPDDLLAAYVQMRNRMQVDAPIGNVDLTAAAYTPERIREEEERSARAHKRITAAARDQATGDLVAYSLVFLPDGSVDAIQDDTLVMPAHRGRRLGRALKHATLTIVTRDHPERLRFHTWTAPDNDPMQATNAAFGYRIAEHVHEVQLKF